MKILLLDIETAPNLVHVWGIWQQNVGINQIIDAGYVMCWAAKWLGEKEVMFDSVHQSKPKKMLSRIHALLDKADAVIHYNGKSFDIPTLNKEFITFGFLPPSPYKQIDLCVIAKAAFRFPSNKLEYILKALKIGEKLPHEGHEMWIKCMSGDTKAWRTMEKYNRNDVIQLEPLYLRMRPWIRTHPNMGAYTDDDRPLCPSCGSPSLNRRGLQINNALRYYRYQCRACGAWSKRAYSDKTKPATKQRMAA